MESLECIEDAEFDETDTIVFTATPQNIEGTAEYEFYVGDDKKQDLDSLSTFELTEDDEPANGESVVVKVKLYDGSMHDVDSSEIAYQIAGSIALKEGVKKAYPILLEPIMEVEVVKPDEYMGDVMSDIGSRRGKVEGMSPRSDAQVIKALVPLSEMFGYATVLRSMTQGRAIYSMQFSHNDEISKTIADQLIEKVKGKEAVLH